MNRTRVLHVCLAMLLCVSFIVSGCASKDFSKSVTMQSAVGAEPAAAETIEEAGFAMDSAAPQEIHKEYSQADAGDNEIATQAQSQRKIVKHADLSLETKEFDKALAELVKAVEAAGGYIESHSEDGRSMSMQGHYYERSAQINARVPAEKLSELIASVGGFTNILSKSEYMDDITERYFDSQARLKSLNLQEERLLDILSKAEKLEDVVTLEKALSDVRYEIETLTASIRRMDSQVTYSFLNIHVREVVEYQETLEKPKSFGEKLGQSLSRGARHMVDSVQGFVLVTAELLPVALLWGVIIAVVAVGILKLVRRGQRRMSKTEDSSQENAERKE